MAISFQKAKKEKIWLKVLLGAPSGGGKTFSALRLATGVFSKAGGSGIAAIDTENGRIRYYADEFDFYDIQLAEPYSPEKYIEAIDAAVSAGFKVLIIDSITHEWDYCLDVHNKMPGNSYTNWAKITPRHDAFMEKVLQSQIHIFATVRGKDEYVMEDKSGKQVPKKVGVGYKQRDNIEYNYTVTFNIDKDSHVADVMKDNTHLFEGRYEVLTEKDGEALFDWANSGEKMAEPVVKSTPKETTPDNVDSVIEEITSVFKDKMKIADKDTLYGIVEKESGNKNFKAIKDIEVANKVLDELKKVEG